MNLQQQFQASHGSYGYATQPNPSSHTDFI